jgi:Zn-dependent M32 family carboxypeptidase
MDKSAHTYIHTYIQVTYPLHVILRFELEKGVLDGTLKVEDLPKLWDAKMREYLGVVPPSTKEGVLQDVHWYVSVYVCMHVYTVLRRVCCKMCIGMCLCMCVCMYIQD